MITIRNNVVSTNPGDTPVEASYTWVDARNINRDDITLLEEQYNISSELLADIMDQDEQARIEREDDFVALIVRLPSPVIRQASSTVITSLCFKSLISILLPFNV